MKIEAGGTNRTFGWVLALATLVVAVVLFGPISVQSITTPEGEWLMPGAFEAVLALGLAATGLWAFWKQLCPSFPHESRRLRNGVALVVLQAILLRAAIELRQSAPSWGWSWFPVQAWLWTPWFLTTGFAVMLLGMRSGLLISLSGVLLLYLRADPGPLPLVGCLISSLAGVALVRRPTRRRVLRAGATSGALLGAIGAIQAAQASTPLETTSALLLVPTLVGLISAFLLLALLPVMEWVLGEMSDVSLVEYGSGHPLLDRLKEEAPGTWHHSLNVADLAENAAVAIGARALFCRTAALYHDVGKLKLPSMFAENMDGPSPHENLDPRESAERIIDHVAHGLELARKHRLPKPFREIIAEHHGTSVVRFFFAKACAQLRPGESPESIRPSFSYPGPPPSSRESGIIALADIVEAASRAVGPKPPTEARAFVRKLIADRIAEGELAQCPLTLAELALAEDSFIGWLRARHHQRPSYPPAAPAFSGAMPERKEENAIQPA